MFFSKLFIPAFAIASIACTVFATPVAVPKAEVNEKRVDVEARQLGGVTSILTGVTNDLAPILQAITSVAGGGTGTSPITSASTRSNGGSTGSATPTGTPSGGGSSPANQLGSLLGQVTSILQVATGALGGASPIPTSEITVVISLVVGIVTSVVGTLTSIGGLSLLNGLLGAGSTSGVDTSLAGLLSILSSLSPGLLTLIAAGLPLGILTSLPLLGLLNVLGLLGLGGIIGGL